MKPDETETALTYLCALLFSLYRLTCNTQFFSLSNSYKFKNYITITIQYINFVRFTLKLTKYIHVFSCALYLKIMNNVYLSDCKLYCLPLH